MPVSKRERERDENQPLDKDPLFTNTTFLPCRGNCGKNPLVEIHSWSWNDNETKYIIHEDCYHQGNNDYTCAKHKEKNEDNNIPGPSSAIPSSVKEYFESNNVKSIELKDNNKWIITYKNKKETKTIPLANTPSQIQPLRAYFQNKGINSLDSSELENQQNQNSPDNPNKTNYLPYYIVGGIVIVAVILFFWFVYPWLKKNSN